MKKPRQMKIGGLPIQDAKKHLTISITAGDCRAGNTKDPATCAAAIACLREADCQEARIHISRTYLKIGKKWVRWFTPHALRDEIIAFDRGGKFQPGTYELVPVSMAEQRNRGKKHTPTAIKRGRADKKRPKHHTVAGVRPHAFTEMS